MSDETGSDIQRYVEDKITKITLKAKNFSVEEMEAVDDYCKKIYDNNRKLMILDLIRYKEENLALNLLDDKLNFLFQEVQKLQGKKEEPGKKKVSWKGFSGEK